MEALCLAEAEDEDPPCAAEKKDLVGFTRQQLAAELHQTLKLPSFRARQLIRWIHRRRATDFHQMTDIALPLRQELARRYLISRPTIKTLQVSADGARKYLFSLSDQLAVESVFIRQEHRNTLCVSSQVGCAIGCAFCRTGTMGLVRNLTPNEIIGQVLAVRDDLAQNCAGTEFNNVVFMGMGEPLHNFDNLLPSLHILGDELGHNFSVRKITVSTSGLVPAIKRFGEENAPANLAVSLNATTDEVRSALIPLNKRFPLAVLLETLRNLPLKRRERITIEYVLLKGVNDTEQDLRRLPGLLHGLKVKVNLIPYNANPALPFQPPDVDTVKRWQSELLCARVSATIRWSKGEDISAACGQLATESAREKRGGEER